MLYILHIIEYLMENTEDSDENSDFHDFLIGENTELTPLLATWRSDFINLGGFDHLVTIYHNLKNTGYDEYTVFSKKILSFVLKILRNYIMASFSTEIDGVYRYV